MPTLAFLNVLFDEPLWLLALPVAVAIVLAIALRSESGWRSRPVSIALRLASVALLVAALARPVTIWRADDVATIVVRDVSDSVPRQQDTEIDRVLAAEAAALRADDRLGVVTAAATPLLRHAPLPTTPTDAAAQLAARADASQSRDFTDLGAAVSLALSALPPDAGGRLTLVSDGHDLAGEFDAAVRAAAAAGIPIDVVPIDAGERPPVVVESVLTPDVVRAGSIVPLRVTIESREALDAWITVRRNGVLEPVASGERRVPVSIRPGRETFVIDVAAPASGACRFDVRVETNDPRGDADLETGSAIAFASGRARVAVVSNSSRSADLVSALEGEDVDVVAIAPSALGTSAAELASFDAIVLCDFGAFDTTRQGEAALMQYVRDFGGGLVTVGGHNAYGAGGWIGSRFAEILPLELDPPPERHVPSSALALVIDRSGSMSRRLAGGKSQLDLAADAAIAAVRALGRDQFVTVIAFDAASDVIVPLTLNADPEAIGRAIASLGSGGGTDLFPALELARTELSTRPLGTRHVVVLSDGETAGDAQTGLAIARAMANEGTTLSTIVVGDSVNAPLMRGLAQLGGGRHWAADSKNAEKSLTPIFQRETFLLKRSLIAEGDAFRPTVTSSLLPLAGVSDPLPEMTGYVVTAPRLGLATIDAQSPRGDPILAHWNHGLGRVYAWTGDATAAWDRGWLASDSYATLWRHLLKRSLRPADDGTLVLRVRPSAGETAISLSVRGEQPGAVRTSAVRLVDGAGVERLVPLERTSLTEFVGRTGPLAGGIALAQAAVDDGASVRTARRGVIVRDDRERLAEGTDLGRLTRAAATTGGRVLSLAGPPNDLWSRDNVRMPYRRTSIWDLCAVLAAALFVADTAARRLALRKERMLAAAAAAVIPVAATRRDVPPAPDARPSGNAEPESAATPELGRLRAAKDRVRGNAES
ncbi:MAG: VWA domain-containing protein [Phycisphaerae bacterium]|nr:VWA domain-containing protein [Phycisphaerae bacterium]